MELENGSPYDKLAAISTEMELPLQVTLNDVTLREGLQAAQRHITSAEKVELARLLDAVGLPQIQVGYLGRSASDRDVVRMMRDNGIRAALEGICPLSTPSWQQELEVALSVSPDRLNVILPSSDIRLRESLGMTRDEMLARAVEGVRFARAHCDQVSFSPVDTTRTELSFLKEIVAGVTEAGADRFYLIDTAGVISPAGMRFLARAIRAVARIQLAVHCHDDFGLAVANGLIAVEQGVEVVDVCVNGMGKRAGNLSLEEIALALTVFHGFDLGLRLDRLYSLSHRVAEVTGVPILPNKAIVGRDAFDVAVDRQLRGTVGHRATRPLDPAAVGHPAAE